MQSRTYKFVTNKANYSLFTDLTVLNSVLEKYRSGNGRFSISAHITVIVQAPTKIKFSSTGDYQDMMLDKVFDSDGFDNFNDVIIKDTGITGEITINIG